MAKTHPKKPGSLLIIGIIVIGFVLLFLLKTLSQPHLSAPVQTSDLSALTAADPLAYPQAQMVNQTQNDQVTKLEWQTTDPLPTVVDWYLSAISSLGWTIDVFPANLDAQDIQYLTALKNSDQLQLSLTRSSPTDPTQILLVIQPNPTLIPEDE